MFERSLEAYVLDTARRAGVLILLVTASVAAGAGTAPRPPREDGTTSARQRTGSEQRTSRQAEASRQSGARRNQKRSDATPRRAGDRESASSGATRATGHAAEAAPFLDT